MATLVEMWRRWIVLTVALGCAGPLVGCGDEGSAAEQDAGESADGGLTVADSASLTQGIAPAGTIAGELPAGSSNPVEVAAGGSVVLRVDTLPGEHTAFRLDFDAAIRGVVMSVSRWDGNAPVELDKTDAGAGLRVLAVLDQEMPRTFWVRISAPTTAVPGTLTVVRTPFREASQCTDDCARLLQLPLPNDARDGYRMSGAIFRYQFGRRDLLMFLRHAGRAMFAAGEAAFVPEDLSQWDGLTPGVDVGSPRHASHQRGKDVDLSLYGLDGLAPWRTYCTTRNDGSGRECVAGTRMNFDGPRNARMFGAFLASRRVTNAFLDAELIPAVREGATALGMAGALEPALLPLYTDGKLQHWPNHDNHIHIRVSEATTTTGTSSQPILVFEAP